MNASPARKKPPLAIVGQSDKFNAIQKVCAILRVLAQSSPLRLTEIADATSLNKATTLRILGSLIEEGFVSRVTGAKTYELGQEARVMAVGARRTVDIAELAQPSLLRLSERSADTALLSVRSGVEALYLARSVGSHPLQPNYLQIGSRRPLGVGAGSLALMVWLPDAEIDAIIEVIMPRLAKSPRITPSARAHRRGAQARPYRAARRRLSRHGRGRCAGSRRHWTGRGGVERRRVQRPHPAARGRTCRDAEEGSADPVARDHAAGEAEYAEDHQGGLALHPFVQRDHLALLAQRRQQRSDQQHDRERQADG